MTTIDWTVRAGPVGYAHPYDASRVKFLGDGWWRFTLNNQKMSAGLLGPKVEPGIYRFEIRGRLDNFDPAPVFSIYTYDDATANEQDWIEVDRQRDPNNPNSLIITAFLDGKVEIRERFPVRAFNQHLLEVSLFPDRTKVELLGVFPGGNKIVVAQRFMWTDPIGHQLRMGFWLPKSGYVFADSNSRGPRVIDVRGTFEPFDSDTGDGG